MPNAYYRPGGIFGGGGIKPGIFTNHFTKPSAVRPRIWDTNVGTSMISKSQEETEVSGFLKRNSVQFLGRKQKMGTVGVRRPWAYNRCAFAGV
jgi:hypothetical protein